MANIASPWPLERAEAFVTWPISFVPFGNIARPSVDLTASVMCAVICSPGFAFFESMEESSLALIAVPPAKEASLLVVSEGCGACAAAPAAQSVATAKAAAKRFMEVDLLIFKWMGLGSWGFLAGWLGPRARS